MRIFVAVLLVAAASACSHSIEDFGVVAGKDDAATCVANAKAMTAALVGSSYCTLVIPAGKVYNIIGGIFARDLVNITIAFDGELRVAPLVSIWPLEPPNFFPLVSGEDTGKGTPDQGRYSDVLVLRNITGLIIKGTGHFEGQGVTWWNMEVLPQVFGHLNASRPKLFRILESRDIYVDSINFHNSPAWTFILQDVKRVEVNNITVTTDRKKATELKEEKRKQRIAHWIASGLISSAEQVKATPLEPEDLNTDGIDCSGSDIYIHDSYIQNDDDSIAVKPCSKQGCTYNECTSNIRVERLVMTGFGASIGSVPPDAPSPYCVRDIVMRNISMPKTGKGIYIKSNPSCESKPGAAAILENILYEDVVITEPRWWSIFIGPQQQHEPGEDVGEKCALTYPLSPHCPTEGCATFRNITLRRVDVYHPWLSAGVIMGNSTNPMSDVVFDRVVFHQQSRVPFGDKYVCQNVDMHAEGCVPAPAC